MAEVNPVYARDLPDGGSLQNEDLLVFVKHATQKYSKIAVSWLLNFISTGINNLVTQPLANIAAAIADAVSARDNANNAASAANTAAGNANAAASTATQAAADADAAREQMLQDVADAVVNGVMGPQGPQGIQGPAGAAGADFTNVWVTPNSLTFPYTGGSAQVTLHQFKWDFWKSHDWMHGTNLYGTGNNYDYGSAENGGRGCLHHGDDLVTISVDANGDGTTSTEARSGYVSFMNQLGQEVVVWIAQERYTSPNTDTPSPNTDTDAPDTGTPDAMLAGDEGEALGDVPLRQPNPDVEIDW